MGRFFLIRGADARKVLDQCYDVVTKQQPDYIEAHFATAELVLAKDDDALGRRDASQSAPGRRPGAAFSLSDGAGVIGRGPRRGRQGARRALKINPRHVDSLLLQADHLIDAERYAEAATVLKQVFDVNPREPRASAYQAVLAHLRSDAKVNRPRARWHWRAGLPIPRSTI